jgi:alkylation response protein AidB-like acyl-CoA dehydrogenase
MYSTMHDTEVTFLKQVREFVSQQVLPNTRKWEEQAAFDDEIWPLLGEVGLLKMGLPVDQGGVSTTTYCEAIRELAKGDPALAMNLAAINALVIAHIVAFATDEQRSKYLKPATEGKLKLAWGLTEPDAGSDARRVKTVATEIPGEPGRFHLTGRKMFITNGGKADVVLVIARTGEKEMSAFLVETYQAGFTLEKRIHTVGVSASNTVQFRLENAVGWHTPCTFEQAISFLYKGRLGIAAMAVGIAEKAAELAIDYSKQREQFNRRLCDMQSVQNMLADNELDVTAANLLLQKGAHLADLGLPIVKESSMAKLFASEAANRVTNRAIQIHGGRGMTREFLVEKLWRDAKLTEIGEGCSEIQRMVIAKQLTK